MKRLVSFTTAFACSLAAIALYSPAASAAELVVAFKEPPATMDPHYMTSPQAGNINSQIFEPLVARDPNNGIIPKLAESWEITSDTTWVFKLRRGVKFTDGTPFTAQDVLFTFQRAPNVPNAPSSFATYLNQVEKAEATDDYTIRLTTKGPAPTLLENLAVILIVSRKNGEGASTDDYNSGKAQVGTGPYKFVSWTLNDNTILDRKDDYWGPKPEWTRVTYKMIQNDSARVAGLLSGSIDVIESVPTQEIERLKANPAVNIWTRETSRIAYIAMDGGIEAMAGNKITGPNGEKLDRNPLADPKLRQALKLAVDVNSFVTRIYQGQATPSAQFLSATSPAFNPDIKLWSMDVERAKQLLAESGWAGKLKIDLGVASAVFQNAIPTAEALAQSWARIGIPTTVSNMPYPVFLRTRNDRQMPIYLMSYQNQSGSAEFLNPVLLHTRQAQWGSLNMSRYSNQEFDKLVEDALSTMDFAKRQTLLKNAAAIVDKDGFMVPMFLLGEATGTKKTINFKPRIDRYLIPAEFTTAKAGEVSTAK